jgi:transcriptional regulator with XRE-family HTH domain
MKTLLSVRLKTLRKSAKLTQKNVADMCGLREPQYVAYEHARTEPSLEGLNALATCFGVSVDQLVGRVPLDGLKANENLTKRLDGPENLPPWLVPLLPKLATLKKSELKALEAFLDALNALKT